MNEAAERSSRVLSRSSTVQLGLTITLCAGMVGLAWGAWSMKADALTEIREQYVNKDYFNAKFELISIQLATLNEKVTELKLEVTALRRAGEQK